MRWRAVVALVVVALSSACGTSPPASSSSSALNGTITVLAASSLTSAYTAIVKDFQQAYPGSTVKFSFGG